MYVTSGCFTMRNTVKPNLAQLTIVSSQHFCGVHIYYTVLESKIWKNHTSDPRVFVSKVFISDIQKNGIRMSRQGQDITH